MSEAELDRKALKEAALKAEKISERASELTFDWLCGEFEDLPDKLAEDMSAKIYDSIIWALSEGSVIDDFADAEQQVATLTARAEAAEQRERRLREAVDAFLGAYSVQVGRDGRRSWNVNPVALAAAHDLACVSEEEA